MIWGWGSDVIDIGSVAEKYCSVCEKSRPYHLFVKYKYFGVWFIFNFVTDKEYSLVCNICHRGYVVESSIAEKMMIKSPIPFMRRMGCLIFIIIAAIIFATLFVLNKYESKNNLVSENTVDSEAPYAESTDTNDGLLLEKVRLSNSKKFATEPSAEQTNNDFALPANNSAEVINNSSDKVISEWQNINVENEKAKKYSLNSYRYFYALDFEDQYPRDVYPPKLRELFMPDEISCITKDCTNYYYGKTVIEIYKWLINNQKIDIETRKRAEIDLDIYVQRSRGTYTSLSVDDASNYVKNAARPYYPEIL